MGNNRVAPRVVSKRPKYHGCYGSGRVEIVRQDRNMDVKKPVNAETSTGLTVIGEDYD